MNNKDKNGFTAKEAKELYQAVNEAEHDYRTGNYVTLDDILTRSKYRQKSKR